MSDWLFWVIVYGGAVMFVALMTYIDYERDKEKFNKEFELKEKKHAKLSKENREAIKKGFEDLEDNK